jgi:hypothetical protein
MGSTIALNVEPEGTNILAQGERAGDEQRHRVADHVSDCYARGYIDADEMDRRNNLIMDMHRMPTRDHLAYMIRDLPPMRAQRRFIARTTRREKIDEFLTEGSPRLLLLQILSMVVSVCLPVVGWASHAGHLTHLSALAICIGGVATVAGIAGFIATLAWIIVVWD